MELNRNHVEHSKQRKKVNLQEQNDHSSVCVCVCVRTSKYCWEQILMGECPGFGVHSSCRSYMSQTIISLSFSSKHLIVVFNVSWCLTWQWFYWNTGRDFSQNYVSQENNLVQSTYFFLSRKTQWCYVVLLSASKRKQYLKGAKTVPLVLQ